MPLLVYATVNWYQNEYESLPVLGADELINGVVQQHHIDSFTFINQDGKLFSSEELKNKIVLANFFFTGCGSVCPKMMSHVKAVQQRFSNDPKLAIISFTVDPQRDNVEKLKAYALHYNINNSQWNLLTGNKRGIYRLARKSFYLTATDGDGGDDDFIHSEQLVLIDKQQRIRGYYKGTDDKETEALKKDILKLEYEK